VSQLLAQLLHLDGHAFTFIREIAANLLGADGVAMRGNRIVVADTDHNQIKVLSDLGEVIAVYAGPNDGVYWGPFNEPRDVAIDGNGRIVVVDAGNSRVVGVIHDEPRPVRKRLRPGS
jgi:DNA-binding beta-propeller fold protein YncE